VSRFPLPDTDIRLKWAKSNPFLEDMQTMQETAQEYQKRMLSYAESQTPLKVLAETPKKLERLLKRAPASKLRKRPEPGKWSVTEVLAHIADTELVGGYRMRLILGAPGTPIQAFNQDDWVVAGHYDKRDPRKSLEQFRAIREANLTLLKSLTPEQWKHHGVHAERGVETIETIARMFAGHDINHVKQIERIVSAKKGKQST
jgi:hypothetical protein